MADKTQLTNMKANRSTNKQHFDQLYTIYTINNINIKINLSINLLLPCWANMENNTLEIIVH